MSEEQARTEKEKSSKKRFRITRRKLLIAGGATAGLLTVGAGAFLWPVSSKMNVAVDCVYLRELSLEERTLDANGVQQYYVYGSPAAGQPILVFLHGTTVNHTIFKKQIEYFRKKGYGIVAIDLRGDGYSTPKSADESFYSLENRIEDLAAIVEKEKLQQPHIVGHSMGALIGAAYVAKHDNSKTLTMIEGSYDFKKTLTGGAKVFFALSGILRPMFTAVNWVADDIAGIEPTYIDFSKLDKASDNAFAKITYERATPEYVQAMHTLSRACMTYNIEGQLDKIEAPTLLLGAGQSQFITPESHYELQKRIGKNAEVKIIPEAKHQLLITHADVVNKTLEEFVEQYK